MPVIKGPNGEIRTGVAAESDAEVLLTDRLGPKARHAINNACRELNVAAILRTFMNGRQPIERDGDFFPAPAYNSPEGDEEFARYIENYLKRSTGMTSADATLIADPARSRYNRIRR